MSETILVVNAGSSSIKFQLFSLDARDQLNRLLKGQIEGIGAHPRLVAAAMGGIEGFVFTAGIGENAPSIREAVADRLAWLGLDFDGKANASGKTLISRPSSRVACYVIPTDEELMIARHTLAVLRAKRDAA